MTCFTCQCFFGINFGFKDVKDVKPVLYTEDLQHGQLIDNTLTILNPFKTM